MWEGKKVGNSEMTLRLPHRRVPSDRDFLERIENDATRTPLEAGFWLIIQLVFKAHNRIEGPSNDKLPCLYVSGRCCPKHWVSLKPFSRHN